MNIPHAAAIQSGAATQPAAKLAGASAALGHIGCGGNLVPLSSITWKQKISASLQRRFFDVTPKQKAWENKMKKN